LGDPFASNLDAFPWLKLQNSFGKGEVKERGEGVVHGFG
jgi:hypothetical protein